MWTDEPRPAPRRSRGKRRSVVVSARIGRWVKVRIAAVGVLTSLLFAGMAYTAYGLQIEASDKYRRLARRQQLRTVEVPAPRGPIVDVQGRELAVTADADSVYVNPREVVDVAGSADTLAEILSLDVRELESRLASRRHFAWIERHVAAEEAEAVRAAELPGVYITQEPRRYYPGRELAGPLLGFAGIDGKGLDGIELAMDELLVGKQTSFNALRDASGRLMMADGLVRPEAGATLTLTIDRSIQHIADTALQRAVTENEAKAGALIVLDVATGEVLAMSSWPGYDPNSPGRAVATKARNRAVTDTFEVGSVMKVFTVAAALDAGAIRASDVIDVEKGRLRIGKKTISDTHDDAELAIGDIIKRSSNVGAVKIAQRLGKEGLHRALMSYGFGQKRGIEVPGEQAGLLRPPKRWGDLGLATISYGYGLTVTPLQVAAALAAVGNGGVYHEPRVIRAITAADGTSLYHHQTTGERVMQESTARALWPMLHSVFDKGRFRGTAYFLESKSFALGGKTGTARKVDPETRQYSTELYISSFAGLAPIDDPRIAVVVIVDEPHGEYYYGGRVAGPAFVEVADQTLRYLGVPPKADGGSVDHPVALADHREQDDGPAADGPEHAEHETGLPTSDDSESASELAEAVTLDNDMVMIPDFSGMSIRRALDSARRAGIEVEIEGTGRAVEQFPPPGPAPWPADCRIVFSDLQKPASRGP